MFYYQTIASDNDCIHLSKDDAKNDNIYITFFTPDENGFRTNDSEVIAVWDDSHYIYENIAYPILNNSELSFDILQYLKQCDVDIDEFVKMIQKAKNKDYFIEYEVNEKMGN